MSYFHIRDCPDADLPSCSIGDSGLENCSLSCLTLWVAHLKECENCLRHLDDWPICGSAHCLRVHQCWNLRRSLHEYVRSENITWDGEVFKSDLERLRGILMLDYLGISYDGGGEAGKRRLNSDQSYLAKRTRAVFKLLGILANFGGVLQALEMRIDGIDLMGTVEHILELDKGESSWTKTKTQDQT